MNKEKYLEELSNELQISKNMLRRYIYIVGTNKENIKDYSLNSNCAITRKDNGFNISYTAEMLNYKDAKIAELEDKLARCKEHIKIYIEDGNELEKANENYFDEVKRLKRQLIEKDEELLEIKQRIAEKASKEFQEMIDKRENHNQDKISFAVEQLEKVLPSIKATIELAENRHQMKDQVDIIIDNQIEELKKEMK